MQKAWRTALPGPAGPARPGPVRPEAEVGKPEAAQHVGQVYSHLPHTEPSYPQQNAKEQKQRVSESTAQAGAGPPGRTSPPSGTSPDRSVGAEGWQVGGGVPCWAGAHWDAGPGPSSGGGVLLKVTYSGLVWANQPDGRCAAPVMKEALPGLAAGGRPVLAKGLRELPEGRGACPVHGGSGSRSSSYPSPTRCLWLKPCLQPGLHTPGGGAIPLARGTVQAPWPLGATRREGNARGAVSNSQAAGGLAFPG